MRRAFLKAMTAALAAAAIFGGTGAVQAETPAEFYQGKAIKWIVPYKPGGGYDEYSRIIAPFLEKYTGARVDIVNMPGAGGMKGANEIFNAPDDGLTIGIINGSAMVTNEIAGIAGAKYKVADYNFLGRVVADQRVLIVSTQSGLNSFEDLLASDEPVLLGATGLGGSTYVDAVVVGLVMGNNQKVIHGFNSSSDVRQALLRGDIQGMWGSLGSALNGIEAGDMKVITHDANKGIPQAPDVPSVFEHAANTDNPARSYEILATWDALSAVGRPVATSPGVPEDRVAFLQKAFSEAMNDPEFVTIAEDTQRDISFLDGNSMKLIARASTQMKPEVKEIFVAAIRGEI
ncbi:tripartite tricarboxylate transporter substrate-binding protein [Labrenzia sp. OB1]|uniref:Bug family tripartite tricarboxylate transporter substrate binding protein n=1 Tax=Labrenzia sp. OB1 TaxID=1561204 RepID=UPI0009EEE3E3|nr:tripartite tricarboxylate transporter substrate-binding protein [Labrenzia sp. OB1]